MDQKAEQVAESESFDSQLECHFHWPFTSKQIVTLVSVNDIPAVIQSFLTSAR